MFDGREVRVGGGGELVVDLVAQGGPVVQVAPEPLGDVKVEILMDAPGEGSCASETKVIPARLIFLLLTQVIAFL